MYVCVCVYTVYYIVDLLELVISKAAHMAKRVGATDLDHLKKD